MTLPRPLSGVPRRLAIALVFAMHGATVGTLFARIAELRLSMGLSEAELGLALVGTPTGVFAGSLIISGAIERFGTRKIMLATVTSFAGTLVLTALALGTATLYAALVLFGFGLTSTNIAMNVEADRIEAATGRRLINRCHGSWGVGFLVASLAGTGMVAAGVPPLAHFLLLFALAAAFTVVVIGPMQASPPRAHRAAPGAVRRLALPTMGVVLVLGFAFSGMILEGSSRSWSVIYLRDEFVSPAWVSTLALPAFVVMQSLGRFIADPLIERIGPVRLAMALSVVSALGLGLAVAAETIPVVLAGFALVGLGISTTQPQALSAVARRGDRPSSENVASFSTLVTAMNFLAPPLFGFVASHYGVRVSFAMLIPLPLIALAFARFLEPPPEPAFRD